MQLISQRCELGEFSALLSTTTPLLRGYNIKGDPYADCYCSKSAPRKVFRCVIVHYLYLAMSDEYPIAFWLERSIFVGLALGNMTLGTSIWQVSSKYTHRHCPRPSRRGFLHNAIPHEAHAADSSPNVTTGVCLCLCLVYAWDIQRSRKH